VPEHRLQVHRFPQRPRLDVVVGQGLDHVVAGETRDPRVDDDRGQPEVVVVALADGVLGAVGLPEERDPRDPVEQGAVEQAVLAATLQHPGQPLQLGTSQRGQQVRHAVVVADVGVLVVQHRLAGLGGEVADVGGVPRVVGEHRATTGGGHHLVAVEGHGRQVPVGRGGPAPVHRAQRLGGVVEDAQPELVGH